MAFHIIITFSFQFHLEDINHTGVKNEFLNFNFMTVSMMKVSRKLSFPELPPF